MRAHCRLAAAGQLGRCRLSSHSKRHLALRFQCSDDSGHLIPRQTLTRVSDLAGVLGRDRLAHTSCHALHLVADRSKKISQLVVIAAASIDR